MKTSKSRALLSPPSLIVALRAGFDAITNHIALILFPITLDLYLWFGPHLRLKQLIESIVGQLVGLYALQDPGAKEMLQAIKDVWMEIAAQFNLFIALRTYPVGVPSLLAPASPVGTPTGTPLMWEIDSMGSAFLIWLLIAALGLVFGALFFDMVSQAVLTGEVNWRMAWKEWPRTSLQVLFLTLFWVSVLIAVSIPGSFIISIVALGGLVLAQCALFLYVGLLIWLLFHLFFSPHGIFVYRHRAMNSIRTGFRLTRQTFVSTALFFLAVIVLSRGLDMLWQVPPATSWLKVVGVVGHAFVATSLLASSFVYYRDADQWVRNQSLRGKPSQNEA
jgi:hypothetical protein